MYNSRREVFDALVSLEPKAKALELMLQTEGETEEASSQKFRVMNARAIAQNPCFISEDELQEWNNQVNNIIEIYKSLSKKYGVSRPFIENYLTEIVEIQNKVVDYYQNRQVEEDLFS